MVNNRILSSIVESNQFQRKYRRFGQIGSKIAGAFQHEMRKLFQIGVFQNGARNSGRKRSAKPQMRFKNAVFQYFYQIGVNLQLVKQVDSFLGTIMSAPQISMQNLTPQGNILFRMILDLNSAQFLLQYQPKLNRLRDLAQFQGPFTFIAIRVFLFRQYSAWRQKIQLLQKSTQHPLHNQFKQLLQNRRQGFYEQVYKALCGYWPMINVAGLYRAIPLPIVNVQFRPYVVQPLQFRGKYQILVTRQLLQQQKIRIPAVDILPRASIEYLKPKLYQLAYYYLYYVTRAIFIARSVVQTARYDMPQYNKVIMLNGMRAYNGTRLYINCHTQRTTGALIRFGMQLDYNTQFSAFLKQLYQQSSYKVRQVKLQRKVNQLFRRMRDQFQRAIISRENSLQNYVQQDNQGRFISVHKLTLTGVCINYQNMFKTLRQRTSILDNRIEQQLRIIRNIQHQVFVFLTNSNIRVAINDYRFIDWNFYARHSVQDLALCRIVKTLLQPHCVNQVNKQLIQDGFPAIQMPQQQKLAYLINYCNSNCLSFKVIGIPSLKQNYYTKKRLIIGPSHISLGIQKKQMSHLLVNRVSYFQNQRSNVLGLPIKRLINWQPTWQLGKQLPIDPSINLQVQLALRCRFMVIDIQSLATQNQRQIPYMICAVGYLGKTNSPSYFCFSNIQSQAYTQLGFQNDVQQQGDLRNQTCIKYFVSWLVMISSKYTREQPLLIWGFNMMGYQLIYILKQLTNQFVRVQLNGSPSQCKSFSLCQGAIVFYDVLKILPPKSLRQICKQFQVVVQKQDLQIGLVSTWQQVNQDYDKIKKYCYQDCVSTLLLTHKVMAGFITIAQQISMPYKYSSLVTKGTASGLGWMFFIQGFLKKTIFNGQGVNTQTTIYNNQPYQIYLKQRQSFYGGVVQVFRHVYQGKVFVVDINSMYPYMLLRKMPWFYLGQQAIDCKKAKEILQTQIDSDMYLFQIIQYQIPGQFYGAFIATKQDQSGKNTYYNSYYNDHKPIYLRGVGLRRLFKHNGFAVVTCVWRYTTGGIDALKQFAQTFYDKRSQTTSQCLKTCYKLLMNSVIGRCSMSQRQSYCSTRFPQTDNYAPYQDCYIQIGDTQLPNIGRLVRITAYVTECSRVYLDQLAQQAGYKNVLYCDTDSLMVTQQGYKNLNQPDTKAVKLGQFKCQKNKRAKQKYYQAGYFKNRKDYILTYFDTQNQLQYLHKAKGVPKKYITRQYSQNTIKQIKRLTPVLFSQPNQEHELDVVVNMKVWRRDYKNSGIIIKDMRKKSNLITDRLFVNDKQPGIPRIISKLIKL